MPTYLTLNEFKSRMRIDHGHEDSLCSSLLDAAEGYIGDPSNGILGRPVLTTSFTEYFDSFDGVALCNPDGAAISSISYTDTDDVTQTLGGIYSLRDGRLVLNAGETWPAKVGEITVSYTAGWSVIPKQIVEAAYFYAGTIYENRHSEEFSPEKLKTTISLMLRGYRRVGV